MTTTRTINTVNTSNTITANASDIAITPITKSTPINCRAVNLQYRVNRLISYGYDLRPILFNVLKTPAARTLPQIWNQIKSNEECSFYADSLIENLEYENNLDFDNYDFMNYKTKRINNLAFVIDYSQTELAEWVMNKIYEITAICNKNHNKAISYIKSAYISISNARGIPEDIENFNIENILNCYKKINLIRALIYLTVGHYNV